ncbi:MAG: T9SS type A sorting domain-containing protein [Bacteroidales bacterium]|nr:T9SS type A sorting domain-containing protein [Bacteroidales bacterium]
MKHVLLFVALVSIFYTNHLSAQCTPDPTCNDIGNPGEMCPETLPPATVNVPYNQVVTVIPPASFIYNGQTVSILKIKVTQVQNLPNGLTYQCNPSNCEFTVTNPLTRYCILLSGTPTTAGTYPLKVHVVPYISVFGVPTALPEQVDDTSLVMIVNQSSGIEITNTNKFYVQNPQPNPFNSTVKICGYSPSYQNVALQVFDVLGNKVYEEKTMIQKGEFTFKFDGSTLKKGLYVYTVTNGKEHFVKQFIKN